MIFTGPFKADIAGMLLLGCCTSARIAMVIMVAENSMVISPDVEAVLGNETHDFPLLYSNEFEQKRLALQLLQDF